MGHPGCCGDREFGRSFLLIAVTLPLLKGSASMRTLLYDMLCICGAKTRVLVGFFALRSGGFTGSKLASTLLSMRGFRLK